MLVKPSLPPHLTEADREGLTESVRRSLLIRAPRNDDELWRYFGHLYGLWFGRRAACPEHVGPFEFLSGAFFQRFVRGLAMAAKGTGKTRAMSVLHHARARFAPKCWIAHMGGTDKQANRCYDYIITDLAQPEFAAEVAGRPIRALTRFKNGSRIEVLAGTIAQASGPHEQIAAVDEFDQLDWEVWQHFNKTPHEAEGIKAQVVLASTRFNKYGPVNRVIDELGRHLSVSTWCVWDCMARCDRDCHNVEGWGQCPLYSRKVRAPDGSETEEPLCGGRAHQARGHLTWDEVVNAFIVSDTESFDVLQRLGEPGTEGLFFPECDRLRHVSDAAVYVKGQPVFLAYDYGYANPACLGAWQMRGDGVLVNIAEKYEVGQLVETFTAWLAEQPWLADVEAGWPDPSAKEPIQRFREFFLAVLGRPVMTFETDASRIDGWRAVRRRLRDSMGRSSILFAPSCRNTWNDLAGLRRKEGSEDCEKKQDHGADQVRYLVRNIEQYLRIGENRELRPSSAGPATLQERAREAAAEGDIAQRWNALRGAGITEAALKDFESRFRGDRREVARGLGQWLSDLTMRGRLRRGGLHVDEDPEEGGPRIGDDDEL